MSKPFNNLKFCSTSVPSEIRSDIVTKIKALGGTHVSHLMSDVNVLIVGNRSTEKYIFSVAHRADIKFIKPSQILKIHEKWLNNEDKKNGEVLNIDNYLLPIFDNYTICLSRISTDVHIDQKQKAELVQFIEENGGSVTDSLTKVHSCIITNCKAGKRYESAKGWRVPVIHPLWILDSLKRKAALEFKYYDIDLVSDSGNIGEGSCHVWKELKKSMKSKRKLGIDDVEWTNEQIKKNPKIWNSIMNEVKLERVSKKIKEDSWDDNDDNILDTSKDKYDVEIQKSSKILDSLAPKQAVFKSLTFKIKFFGHSEKRILSKVIESHAGTVIDDDDDESDASLTIIPYNYLIDDLNAKYIALLKDNKLVTEWYIERSLHYKESKLDTWSKPFYKKLRRLDSPLLISISGFLGIELLHIKKVIELLKGQLNLSEHLNEDTDILIVNLDIITFKQDLELSEKYPDLFMPIPKEQVQAVSLNSLRKKMRYAKSKSIPLVSISFIFDFFKNQENIFPNINNRDWCIYCPKLETIKPILKDFIEVGDSGSKQVQQETSERLSKSIQQASTSSMLPKIPSPIRNKRKENGRLIGRAEVSHFDSILRKPSSTVASSVDDPFNDEEDNLKQTQIKYMAVPPKNISSKDHKENAIRKRTTRAGYKEAMNIFD
ncbi:hypothetical protein WICMUC_001163 [Wickerhamomyces mucosus]|uniref:BRCT domain-containing protein n=1 Tax=Wickerhamomyces mucosus TaxID=1378264 RepID=A0A9P8PX15_9ASCO|nr:hypothetical protein WICMUC_001163 [Wickerhamomyces mucosus]